jgi:hypothetical protein
MFETIYKDNNSTVLINGYKSTQFKTQRGVKQGDALSCGLFILAIDPLIRNLERCNDIQPFTMYSNNRRRNVFEQKVLAYADDITVITTPNNSSYQAIFNQYSILSQLSGLTLNADKTEVINSMDNNMEYRINYLGESYQISPSTHVTICGI